jgi:hypothetical protein
MNYYYYELTGIAALNKRSCIINRPSKNRYCNYIGNLPSVESYVNDCNIYEFAKRHCMGIVR